MLSSAAVSSLGVASGKEGLVCLNRVQARRFGGFIAIH